MRAEPIAFGPWRPDAPNYENQGCVTAENVKPATGGYGPFHGAVPTGDSTDGTCKGAKLLFRSDGTAVVVGGVDDELFHMTGGTVNTDTGLTSVGDNQWVFVQFNQYVIAISATNAPQYLTALDSDTSFSALPGSPPTCATGGRVGNYLMLGNTSTNPYQISWCDENDVTDWSSGTSGSAELQHEYGEITAFGGDRFPVVFQQYGVSRITAVGPPTIFRIETIEEARGCIAPGSVVTVGFMTYFLAHDGFCVTDGNTVRRIGEHKVDKWFFDQASDADKFRTHGAVDWENQCVVWAYYPLTADGFTKLLIYSWEQDEWSSATMTVDRLVENSVGAVSIEQIDAIYGNLDAIPVSLDSPEFVARGRVLGAFIQDGSGDTELNTLNGDALEATLETKEVQSAPGRYSSVTGIYPIVENQTVNTQCYVVTRGAKGGPETQSMSGVINDAGWCPVRASGLYNRFGMTIPEGAFWRAAQGVQPVYRTAGRR